MTPLDDILSGRDAAPAEAPAPEISDADRAANPFGAAKRERDDQGRFAPKSEAQPEPKTDAEPEGDEPEQAEQQRQPGSVPKQALDAARQKAKQAQDQLVAMQRELAELRGAVMATRQPQPASQQHQPEGPPEFWQDPNAATDYRVRNAVDPIRQQFDNFKIVMSRNFAEQQHGKEAVEGAIQALGSLQQVNPAEYQRLEAQATASMDPVGDVVRWHKTQRTLQEVGADPDAWRASERERIRQELLAEMGGAQPDPQQQPATRQPPRLPSSFASAPSGGPRGGTGYGGPRPLSEILPRG